MAIYTGVDGVVRQLEHVDASNYATMRHTPVIKAGIDGVSRDLLSVTEQVERLEFRLQYARIYKIDSSGVQIEDGVLGESLEVLKKYGSLSVSNNEITLNCNCGGKEIRVYGEAYIIFNDGHEDCIYRESILDEEYGNDFSLKVYSYMYCSRGDTGWWRNECLGKKLGPDYVNGSYSNTFTVTDTNDYFWGVNISSGLNSNGTFTVQQTFQKFILNGTSFPITVVNNIKQKEDE